MAAELKHAIFVSTGNLIAPRGGSELRTAALAREFAAAGVRTEVWCYVARNYPAETREIAPNLTVKQRHLAWLDLALAAQKARLAPITDLAGWLKHARGKFARELREAAPDVVIFTFPWFAAWQEAVTGVARVYDAHNVETDYWAPVLRSRQRGGEAALGRLAAWERRAVVACERVAVCTAADGERFVELGSPPAKITVAPNGFDPQRIPEIDAETRHNARERLKLNDGTRMALFMGRNTAPNREAVEQILKIAGEAGDARIHFFVVGAVGEAFARIERPNLTIAGEVEGMGPYLQAADIGINPMMSGSGSNLKLAEFAAAGLGIVTTEFGLRGYEDWKPYVKIAGSVDEWVAALKSGEGHSKVPKEALEAYSWPRLAERMMEVCEEAIRGNSRG